MMTFIRKLKLPTGVLLALLFLSAAKGQATEAYVLAAGVDNYPDVKSRLQGCVNDARMATAAFTTQSGKLFTRVYHQTLVDHQATRGAILLRLHEMARKGQAGDYMVLFLSGHGGRTADQQTWFFCPYDYDGRNLAGTALTDRQILSATDVLVRQGKRVVVIVDACYSGQLNITARNYLQNYRQGGGLAILASSAANQTSQALGQYSAFAKAFADSMSAADSNRDGRITLAEIHTYTFPRTQQLAKGQYCQVNWSASLGADLPLARMQGANPPPQQAYTWVGQENLSGFGQLAFTFHPNGRAVMQDVRGAAEGTWSRTGNQVTLRFRNGRVIYQGTMNGNTMSGTAHNERVQWGFSVRLR